MEVPHNYTQLLRTPEDNLNYGNMYAELGYLANFRPCNDKSLRYDMYVRVHIHAT